MIDEILSSQNAKICVIAAPGSGKTKRILIPKTAQILENEEVDPEQVLLLSFSRLSAKDLKSRVSSLGHRAPRATTVHSLCLSFLLSENDHDIRTRVESILLDFEKEALIWDLKLTFPNVSKSELKKALEAFSAGWATQPHDEVFEESEFERNFKAAVVNWLSEHQAAMMEEIVYEAVSLAQKINDSDFIRRPQYILVDEYQDLNRLEQEFINILAAESSLLLAVGDPNQSIYGFKFSYPEGIVDFSTAHGTRSWNSLITGRCSRRIVGIANQLIQQANPGTTEILESLHDTDGKTHFVQKETQEEEFAYVLNSIASRLQNENVDPKDIIVLSPKKKLGVDFADYLNANKSSVGIPDEVSCVFESKIELTLEEQEKVLLFALLTKPDSLLHMRAYLGLGREREGAHEIQRMKERYGGIQSILQNADPNDFPTRNTRVRAVCERAANLREFLEQHRDVESVRNLIDEIFAEEDESAARLRSILPELVEEGDTLAEAYSKFSEHLRAVPTDESNIRAMTLMASKGLDAKHVYIIGCNAGNIPGVNRSSHMTDHKHREERRRLLFVGVTRAIETLTISWARYIPFSQSMQHHTAGVGVRRRRGGQTQRVVGISPFLQDLRDITWES